MQIHPDTDSGQTLCLKFYMKNILKVGYRSNIPKKVQKPFWKAESQVYLLVFVVFHAPESGSAFPVRIRIQDSQISGDWCGSGSTILVCLPSLGPRSECRKRLSLDLNRFQILHLGRAKSIPESKLCWFRSGPDLDSDPVRIWIHTRVFTTLKFGKLYGCKMRNWLLLWMFPPCRTPDFWYGFFICPYLLFS